MEEGFERATSSNLPTVNMDMILDYLMNRKDCEETKHMKSDRSARKEIGDNAIGFVKLKRDGDLCYVLAQITPEHKVHNKSYNVRVAINEKDEDIECSECLDCPASEGGCKHGIAMVFWLQRRSIESSRTSEVCYWRASELSKVGSAIKAVSVKELFGVISPPRREVDPTFLQESIRIGREAGCTGMLFMMPPNDIHSSHN